MFKNTTRRGLAVGAAIALAFSGLAAAPAQAAGEVVLAPSAGTSYNTFVTEDFTLQASLGAGQPSSNAVQLKYKIEKAAGATVSYGVSTSAAVTTGTDLAAAATSVVVAADGAGALTQNFIKLAVKDATSVSDTVNVTVTAFVDSNNNSALDSGEFASAQVVTFKKYSEVTTTVGITAPVQRDTAVAGTLVLDGINRDQVQSAVGAVVSVNGAAQASVSATSTFSRSVSALGSGATVSAHAVVDNYTVGAESATYTATGSTVFAVTASAVTGDNAKGSAGTATVRTNSTFQVKGTALNGTTSTASGVAGAAVTLKVTSSQALSATKTLTINGTTYTASSALPTALELVSDASGNVAVTVTPAGFAASDKFSFYFTSQTIASDVLEATETDAVYTATAGGTGYLTVAPSGAIAVDYTVADQWSVVAPSNFRLVAAYDGTTKYLPLSAGKVTAAFTATSSATTLNVTNTAIQSQSATTLNWADVSGAVTASAVAVKTTAVAASFTTAPTHSTPVVARATTSNDAGYTNRVQINGQVNHAGQAVTVTSAGVKFAKATPDAAAVADSFTTTADGAGWWTVSAYVTTVGGHTFSYVAGAATASTFVTVAAVYGNEGTNLSIVVLSGDYAAPGSTVRAKVVLTDEFGNPVAADNDATESFAVTVEGPGFRSSLPTKLGSDGESTEFSVLLGSADTGKVTITATYDADGTGTAKAAVTATKDVTIGSAPAVDQKLTVGTFKGYVAIYTKNYTGSKLSAKVAGKWLSVSNLSSFTRTVRLTGAGYTIKVDLYIDGKFVKSETVVTK